MVSSFLSLLCQCFLALVEKVPDYLDLELVKISPELVFLRTEK